MPIWNVSGRQLMTAEALIAFEADIAAEYNAGRIKAPVHLSGGNEQQLINLFTDIADEDWVFSTWRSHYHALLHGVPPERLRQDILAGRSITLNYNTPRFVTSAIVGGTLPIATGVALALKRRGERDRWVHCFVGDMCAGAGAFHEALSYARGHDLPIRFIVEDNGVSVGTPTMEVWGDQQKSVARFVTFYNYKLAWPHSGAGKWVNF